mgnify:CR=1 FL=1
MSKVLLCIEFRGGKGHCYVTIPLSGYEIVKFETTECYEYNLAPGTYDLLCEGVSPAGGTKIIATDADGNELAKKAISKEGYYSKKLTIHL